MRLGTRASMLARTQSATVGNAWAEHTGGRWEEVLIATDGDDLTRPLAQVGNPGIFVSRLRDALLSGEVDVIVHSFKDLPSAQLPGVTVAAVPKRADARDALISAESGGLAGLPIGAVVGTSSPRRARALLAMRPDLAIEPIRGNVDTRLRKVRDGQVHATVLAMAGLLRLGKAGAVSEILPIEQMLPAPAQGALAVECRTGERELMGQLAAQSDKRSLLACTAERAVLAGVGALCTTAVGAYATFAAKAEMSLRADLADHRGVEYACLEVVGEVRDTADAYELGMVAARALLERQ